MPSLGRQRRTHHGDDDSGRHGDRTLAAAHLSDPVRLVEPPHVRLAAAPPARRGLPAAGGGRPARPAGAASRPRPARRADSRRRRRGVAARDRIARGRLGGRPGRPLQRRSQRGVRRGHRERRALRGRDPARDAQEAVHVRRARGERDRLGEAAALVRAAGRARLLRSAGPDRRRGVLARGRALLDAFTAEVYRHEGLDADGPVGVARR